MPTIVIKSLYRSRLIDERLQHCLHLNLNNYENIFSKILQDKQCHVLSRQQKC